MLDGGDRSGGAEFIHRRGWLAAIAAGGWAASTFAREPGPGDAADRDRAEVEEKARSAGLGPLRVSETDHYLGIGDAPDDFRARSLQICEALAGDYLDHFRFKKFAVERPEARLTLVTLADDRSYAAFTGEPAGSAVGGHYDLETNRLVVFDNRQGGPAAAGLAGRANLVALVHEATHQLTFNTGLLDRMADVPLAVSEGLATYAEVRRPTGSTKLGQFNQARLGGLAEALRAGQEWIPLDRLLADDSAFGPDVEPEVNDLAYAQAWLLIYVLMQPADPSSFRSYLAALRDRRDSSHRLEDARTHLGDLGRLDQALRKLAANGLRGLGQP